MAAQQLAVRGPLTASRLRRGGECSAAPGSAGSQTIREMAEGSRRHKDIKVRRDNEVRGIDLPRERPPSFDDDTFFRLGCRPDTSGGNNGGRAREDVTEQIKSESSGLFKLESGQSCAAGLSADRGSSALPVGSRAAVGWVKEYVLIDRERH
ncbi:unnamed protein product [Pleuronectes platessa]|uniref:Uncharacterized protein n=1 Tax=Pleuronectes platessa TaxID=8262 RepID=A0A9N7U0H2_PLEPL|nr:unnamed protein product [Pleuronectes platessa]